MVNGQNPVYISRDLIILGISIPITFLFLNYFKLSIDSSLTNIALLNFYIAKIILLFCIVYLILGVKFRLFGWLSTGGLSYYDVRDLCKAFFVESIINLILTIGEGFIEGFSDGRIFTICILVGIFTISLMVIWPLALIVVREREYE